MDAQEFRSLQEAYLEVVENQQLDEEKKPLPTARIANQRRNAWNKAKDAVETGNEDERKKQIARYNAMSFPETRRSHLKSKTQKESYDIYDIILSHLLDEGYAETPESAEAIMVNMSEDWRDEIVEELLNERLTGRRVKRAITKFQDQNDRPDQYRKPSENKNPRPNYTLGAVARHKEGSPNPHNPATPEDYRDGGNRPTKRGGRGEKGKAKTGYYGTDKRDSDRGSGNAARRRASGR
jgi:hypothetical protein